MIFLVVGTAKSSKFTKQNNIKVDEEPFEFDNITLDEAINIGKNIFIVAGLMSNKETNRAVSEIVKNPYKVRLKEDQYTPLFIPINNNDKNYQRLRDFVKLDRYPSLIYLQPQTVNGKTTVNVQKVVSPENLFQFITEPFLVIILCSQRT